MSTLARTGSKMERALEIFESNLGDSNHRQLCLEQFQQQLGQVESTAATYYYLCMTKLDENQQKTTDAVISSARKNKYSAVKLKRGSNVASKVHCFFKKSDAQAYNDTHGFNEVLKGVQETGKKLGTVAA